MIRFFHSALFLVFLWISSAALQTAFGAGKKDSLNDFLVRGDEAIIVGGFMEESGLIIDSNDLKSWYQQSAPGDHGLWAVCYGKGKFLAAGHSGSILESDDGSEWRLLTKVEGEEWFFDILFAEGLFIAAGLNGIYISTDGVSWERRVERANAYGLTHGNGLFVAVGYGGRIFTSEDARNWKQRSSQTSFMLRGVAYGNGVYIAVGGEGRHGMVMSFDGETWFETSSGSQAQLMDIHFADDRFTLVGGVWDADKHSFVAGTVEYSTDGKNWVTHFAYRESRIDAVSSSDGRWFALASDSKLLEIGKGGFAIEVAEFSGREIRQLQPVETTDFKAIDIPQLEIRVRDGQVFLFWQSQKGLFYRLLFSLDLKTWQDAGIQINGTGEPHELFFDLPEEGEMFFRLEIHPFPRSE